MSRQAATDDDQPFLRGLEEYKEQALAAALATPTARRSCYCSLATTRARIRAPGAVRADRAASLLTSPLASHRVRASGARIRVRAYGYQSPIARTTTRSITRVGRSRVRTRRIFASRPTT